MDKISGIVPSSPRVTSVDMKEASPVRPGVPSFGRPETPAAIKDQLGVGQTAAKSAAIHENVMDWRSKDAVHANLAAQLSDKFFIKNQKPAEAPVPEAMQAMENAHSPQLPARLMDVASRPTGFKTDEAGSFRAAARPSTFIADEELENEELGPMPIERETPKLRQPEGLYPKGSFIDRTA